MEQNDFHVFVTHIRPDTPPDTPCFLALHKDCHDYRYGADDEVILLKIIMLIH